jgi:protease-4
VIDESVLWVCSVPIDNTSYPYSSPVQPPKNWRKIRDSSRKDPNNDSNSTSFLGRLGKKLFFLVLFAFAGVGASVVIAIISIGVLVNKLGSIETIADDPLPNKMVLTLSLNEEPPETTDSRGLMNLIDREPGLQDIISTIDAAANDKRITALAFRLDSPHVSLATAQEIRGAVKRFRASGKPAYVFSLSYGDIVGGTSDYYLAAGFDQIWMQPTGVVGITGMRIENPYFGGLLERNGVAYQVIAREEYKSAMENMTLRQMSPAATQMMESLLDSLFQQIVTDIAQDRKLDAEKVRTLINTAPITDELAAKSGLVDRLGYRDELLAILDKLGETTDFAHYSRAVRSEMHQKLEQSTDPQIALISGEGVILEGADGKNTPLGRGMEIEDIVESIEAASTDPKIKAIILRLNTPGGSPTASEYLRRALVQAKNRGKPVIVSMGAVTASGGYWIASGATKIVAQPATLTGSIGVISGKPNLRGVSDQYRVGWTSLGRGDNAGLGSLSRPYTWQEKNKMESIIDDSYQAFLDRVAEGRKIDRVTASSLAKGRVWSGEQALKNGLVDALGGIDVAVDLARKTINLDDKTKILLVPYADHGHTINSLFDLLDELGVAILAPALVQSMQQVLGPEITSILSDNGRPQARMTMPSPQY